MTIGLHQEEAFSSFHLALPLTDLGPEMGLMQFYNPHPTAGHFSFVNKLGEVI